MRCRTCHYSLENLTVHRCPECGREFDPDDARTFDVPPQRRWRLVLLSAIVSLVGAFALLAILEAGRDYVRQPPFRERVTELAIGTMLFWPFAFLLTLLAAVLIDINLKPWLVWLRSNRNRAE